MAANEMTLTETVEELELDFTPEALKSLLAIHGFTPSYTRRRTPCA